jgi:hypothetical protein
MSGEVKLVSIPGGFAVGAATTVEPAGSVALMTLNQAMQPVFPGESAMLSLAMTSNQARQVAAQLLGAAEAADQVTRS